MKPPPPKKNKQTNNNNNNNKKNKTKQNKTNKPKSVRRQGVAHAGMLTYGGETRAVAIRRDRVKDHLVGLVIKDRLVGLVIKASASRAEDPGCEFRSRRELFGVESYQWLKNWHSRGYPARRLAL